MIDNAVIMLVGTLITAIITASSNVIVARIQSKKDVVEQPKGFYVPEGVVLHRPLSKKTFGLPTFVIGSILISIILGVIYNFVVPKPLVFVTNPTANQKIDCQLKGSESCSFTVTGVSQNVASDKTLQIFVLLHPLNPASPNWWFQMNPKPAAIDENGNWSTVVWYGSSNIMPETGSTIEMVAVVLPIQKESRQPYVSNPNWLFPKAQSDINVVALGNLVSP